MKKNPFKIFNLFEDMYFKMPLQVFDFWRDRVGELSFSCFIAYAAEDYDLLKKYLEQLNNATLAEFFLVDPNLLFSYAYEQLYYDPDVKNFIKQNRALYILLEEHAKMRRKEKPIDAMDEFLNIICKMPIVSFFCKIYDELLGSPSRYGEEWAWQINNIITECGEDFNSVVNKVLRDFSEKVWKANAYIVTPKLAVVLSPILPFVVPDILAKIRLIKAYKAVKPKKCPSFSKKSLYHNLLAELYLDGKYMGSTEVRPDGFIVFKILKQQYKQMKPKEYVIDVMGLKIKFIMPPEKITETWDKLIEEIQYPLKIEEHWEETTTIKYPLKITEYWEE